MVIGAISGMAGVGKTTLAVRWAHAVSDDFPDGQLYVNLRGFHPALPPLPALDAMRDVIDALGVAPSRVPEGPSAVEALCRSLFAGRRFLILLDNAASRSRCARRSPPCPAAWRSPPAGSASTR
ncbi:hypothetical protein ABZY02_17930 [Streptomyces sp. NPDC006649]|uniref:hypothetical protein n=1 Tax=Streptomyces sp. NPDC006649 TaxID=3156896 RepID=UPI0033ADE3A8